MHAFTTLLFASLPLLAYTQSTGTTTRYWDCCKASCSWPGKSSAVNQPVNTCDVNNNVLTDFNSASGCTGGSAYMCANQTPIVIDSNTAYGYAAVALSAGTESDWCCACYELTFTSGPVAGKKMVVQATNTGGGLSDGNHFDIAIPGGGVGQFNACTKQYGAPTDGWGARYGGVSSRAECAALPAALREGCYWRFDWFKGADNPEVTWRQVTCPSQLTARTGCRRYR